MSLQKNPLATVSAFLLVLVLAVKYVLPYFTPFFIGMLLALLLQPAIDKMELMGIQRRLSAFLFVVLAFGGLVFAVALAINELWQELAQLQLHTSTNLFADRLMSLAAQLPPPLRDAIPGLHTRASELLLEHLRVSLELFSLVPSFLFTFLIAAFTTFFLCRDQPMISETLRRLLPPRWHAAAVEFKQQAAYGLAGYLRAQLILVAISGVLSLTGFLLFRLPYAWVLGTLAGLLDLIPMIGPSGVFLPAVVYYLLTNRFATATGLAIVWAVVLIVRQWWEPQILGSQLGLHPLSSLAAMYLGVRVFGVFGFLIGPVIMIFGKAFFVTAIDHQN